MANPEHVEILKQGEEMWNDWRSKHTDIQPDLREASLEEENLSGADLTDADLRDAALVSAHLIGADLSGADLSGADLTEANLINANLIDANLTRADLRSANFSRADLRGAHLNDTHLIGTILYGAYLDGADLTGASLGFTSFLANDLNHVKGLEEAKHVAPSAIGIDTIYESEGNIPEAFLRGCGVPEDFITYMRSLTVQPIQFYKCFISFTEADDAFSERLYNDLQAKGVRCWRWKEDAKWGKTLMRSIDEAVRLYDKLIIICSEQSLKSPAVIREIERALQKEDDLARQGKEGEVLFPIRLDDYIFTKWNHHRKADVLAKNVGDFRQWKNHDSYQKAFDRLLRDLKAEDKQTAEG